MSAALSTFQFRAADATGALQRGRIDAPSREAAFDQLARRGLFPIEVRERAAAAIRRAAMPAAELALGLRVLADLLESGLPIARALGALAAMATPRWAEILPAVCEAVREGKSLARALEEAPVAVPTVVTGILHAGERGAGLAPAARNAADLCQDAAAMRGAIRAALAYPALLAVAGLASAGLLVGVILPRFAAILGDMGQTLPPSTRLMLRAADVTRGAALPFLVVLGAALAAWRLWTRTAAGRATWDALLLRLPVAGDARMAAATARVCTAAAALLDAGVPIAQALQHGARASGDAAISVRLLAARELVTQGERLSRAIEHHDALAAVAIRLIHAGEESGRLAPLLAHAGRLERDRATRRVQALVRLIEPALIIGFGGIVALVAASLLQALYSVRPAS